MLFELFTYIIIITYFETTYYYGAKPYFYFYMVKSELYEISLKVIEIRRVLKHYLILWGSIALFKSRGRLCLSFIYSIRYLGMSMNSSISPHSLDHKVITQYLIF